jgi:glycosyltransferase involved in cell wall biosynthesis
MKIYKPLVSVLLAVYKPNRNWFIEQLISLNEQTYRNIELLIYDDSIDSPVDEALIKKYITNFSYTLIRGVKNKGSNKAFEELTKVAEGEFFAYCDQDDIWEKEKIALMIDGFVDKDVMLVCCDLSIIDENDQKIANSITEIRKRYKFKCGYNLAKGLLISNFVTGCAMVVKKAIAKKAIPFEARLFHDNWIAVVAALNGKIEFINKPLVRYRQHGANQTGILKGILDKETYYDIKIQKVLELYKSLQQRLSYNDELNSHINYCLISITARKSYFLKPSISSLKTMIEYSKFYKLSILLEIFLPIMPEFMFKFIIKLTKKGIL